MHLPGHFRGQGGLARANVSLYGDKAQVGKKRGAVWVQLQPCFVHFSPVAACLQQVARVFAEHGVVQLGGDVGQGFQDKGPLLEPGVGELQALEPDGLLSVVQDVDVEGPRLVPRPGQAFAPEVLLDVEQGIEQLYRGQFCFKGEAEVQEFTPVKAPGRRSVHRAYRPDATCPLPDPEQGLLQGKGAVPQVAAQGEVGRFRGLFHGGKVRKIRAIWRRPSRQQTW